MLCTLLKYQILQRFANSKSKLLLDAKLHCDRLKFNLEKVRNL
ncbi:hypothetical protein COO91_00425 [Nostoc flagelliforme CCNUN1]|uniref:Uncharacterized protein n=1 Tax=Nostoc flagelliforme CCNUN1 TaxID=2038116 RepID=A0A2K8SGN3_9NOSO|nr:hypothetical protein COO91_00425 [Nostoc flagelliforme CCNUN1]